MKTIRNTTRAPIRISFSGGKVLYLGPQRTGQVPDGALDKPAVVALLKSGKIEVLGDEARSWSGGGEGAAPHESKKGHPQTTVVLPKGNR